MPHKTVQYCSRCGRAFREGQTRYIVTVHIVADFDGHISEETSSMQNARLWQEIERKSEEELTNEVLQNFSFILCKTCRDAWSESPLGIVPRQGDSSATNVH